MKLFVFNKQLFKVILLTTLICIAGYGQLYAQWIAPGTLASAHKEFRGVTSCLKCHTLSEGVDNTACKSCHDELRKKENRESKGLHSRVKSECVTCHTDHKGPEHDITSIDENTFKHSLTGYELKDSHVLKCTKCHKKEDTYLGNSPECLNCHAEIHKKTVPEDCIQCHNYKEWKDHIFDHSKKSEYKLLGKHNEAKCELCHPREKVTALVRDREKVYHVLKFKPVMSESCRDCHYDVHGRQFEKQACDSCHSLEKGWKDYTFRHESDQYKGFKLEGRHKDAECEKCHERIDTIYIEFKSEKTLSLGKFKPLESDKCTDCHFDVHKGHFKKEICSTCHSIEKGWKDNNYDHQSEKSEYKLVGKHKEAACENCHKKKELTYKEFRSEKKALISSFEGIKADQCTTCHFDVHKEQFKEQNCDNCHSVEKGWKEFTFTHESKQYKGFKLQGKHKDVECQKCHKRKEISYKEFNSQKAVQVGQFKEKKSETCGNCHYDVHEGQFKDQKCDACHTPEKEWKDKTFTHDNDNYKGYKLEGKHKEVECEKCHKRSEISYTEFDVQKKVSVGLFTPLESEECSSCHKDGHEGKFKEINEVKDLKCAECHSVEKSFKDHIYKHKKDSLYFKYNPDGQVKESDCAACHFCDPSMFTISKCFEQMGMTPAR